eukprot:10009301-Prorocentrum_lima.AAC.1
MAAATDWGLGPEAVPPVQEPPAVVAIAAVVSNGVGRDAERAAREANLVLATRPETGAIATSS